MIKRTATQSRDYVHGILDGLTRSDPLYDSIYDTVAEHGGVDLSRVSDENAIKMATAIRIIRARRT